MASMPFSDLFCSKLASKCVNFPLAASRFLLSSCTSTRMAESMQMPCSRRLRWSSNQALTPRLRPPFWPHVASTWFRSSCTSLTARRSTALAPSTLVSWPATARSAVDSATAAAEAPRGSAGANQGAAWESLNIAHCLAARRARDILAHLDY